jgi:hypothetical protein
VHTRCPVQRRLGHTLGLAPGVVSLSRADGRWRSSKPLCPETPAPRSWKDRRSCAPPSPCPLLPSVPLHLPPDHPGDARPPWERAGWAGAGSGGLHGGGSEAVPLAPASCIHLCNCALRPAPCALRPAPCALRPAPCALRPAPCALRPAPCAAPPGCSTRAHTLHIPTFPSQTVAHLCLSHPPAHTHTPPHTRTHKNSNLKPPGFRRLAG